MLTMRIDAISRQSIFVGIIAIYDLFGSLNIYKKYILIHAAYGFFSIIEREVIWSRFVFQEKLQ